MSIIDDTQEISEVLTSEIQIVFCRRNRNVCSKEKGHLGACDKKRRSSLDFWKSAPQLLKKEVKHLKEETKQLECVKKELDKQVDDVACRKKEVESKYENVKEMKDKIQEEYDDLHLQFEKLKVLVEQKRFARSRRENTPTTFQTINDNKNSTRYKRQKESKDILSYIHGGEEGAIFGAWDFIRRYAATDIIEKLLLTYKRGRFLEGLYGKFSKALEKSDVGMKKALASKYYTHVSRRSYNFNCKIQKKMFDPETETWCKTNQITYGEYNFNLRTASISHTNIDRFVKGLDIGEIHQIPGYCGVARTVSALVTMICDLNLKIKSSKENLIWFNENENHFIIEFSDDGAPETKELTMSIGSLTVWNLGNRVRSREFHYPLHLISANEKDEVCERLWSQHCEEMELIENNVLNINNEKVTVEFQPSADQAWQHWAANCLTQSATYPSPYANVHKSELTKVGGTIGRNNNTWTPPSAETMKRDLEKLNKFKTTLSSSNSAKTNHEKCLLFMAENGLRQLGPPRIGIFAERIRPEPLHLEINSWQHVLDLLYKEAVRRGKIQDFLSVLSNPVSTDTEKPGCGLKYVAINIKEHYDNESTRHKKLVTRLIGSQAISLAQYSYRVIDCLHDDGFAKEVKCLALAKICQILRDIGALINRINVGKNYVKEVTTVCHVYFNLFSLFFNESCQSTVWTLGYALPYHCKLLYDQYKIGYGILSMQGKESKHSAIKQELRCGTNRNNSSEGNNKWNQIMRASYVRNFYLPYHFPSPSSYHSHYRSRIPSFTIDENYCQCARSLGGAQDVCSVCDSANDIFQCAVSGEMSEAVLKVLKPIQCRVCDERFADFLSCDKHVTNAHNRNLVESKNIIPSCLNVKQLKEYLAERKLSTVGNKSTLQRRLEGALASES